MSILKIETIFDLIKNKESRGFECLYEQHFRMMYGIAYSITADDQMSNDTVQNVIFKLYKLESDKFPKNHEMTWLYTVVKNEALQLLRKKKPSVSIDNVAELPFMDKGIEDFTDMNTYYSLIESLNDKQKQVVTLKVLGGLTHKEISQILGKPIGTIQWIYNNSIKQLRIALFALSAFVVSLGGGFVYSLTDYLSPVKVQPTPQIQKFKSIEMAAGTMKLDIRVSVFGIAFVLAIAIWIIFFKNSDKLPIKPKILKKRY